MMTRDKVRGMLLGVGIGDALGHFCEGWSHEDVRRAYGRITSYIVPDGWPTGRCFGGSDDTLLTLAVADGLLRAGGRLDMDAQVQAHVNAFHVSTQGWGPSTFGAVKQLSQGVPWRMAGQRGGRISGMGNGCPMRVSPTSLLLVQNVPGAANLIAEYCSMTHQTSLAVSAGLAHATGLAYCLQSDPATFNPGEFVQIVVNASRKGRAYFPETLNEDDITERLALCGNYAHYPPERCNAEFSGHCYVFCSLPFTYMLFLRSPRSVESLYEVVSQGQDADTNGSMCAALLGALNGTAVFPDHLVEELEAAGRLVETANRLCDLFGIE